MNNNTNEGLCKDDLCNRDGCAGIVEEHDKDGGCSCHISPPCGYCTTSTAFCPTCGWSAEDEQAEYNKAAQGRYNANKEQYEEERKRRKDADDIFLKKYRGEIAADKLEIRTEPHTHFSMKKIGVFPKGSETPSSLLQHIRGTFGGRFTSFTAFSFSYIAYTD